MAVNAYLSFFDKADGESAVKGHEKWIEVQGWDWEVEAESSWTKGGGASVGKPRPGALRWVHRFDLASPKILGYICTGKAFPKVQIDVLRPGGTGASTLFLTASIEGAYITKVSTSMTEEGNVLQAVEMVFKTIKFEYTAQSPKGGAGAKATFNWDIPAGTASPSN